LFEGLINYAIEVIIHWISFLGYPGIVFLMSLESACLPVPSEIVLPFSGFLVYRGAFDLLFASLAGTLGCLLGSVVAYYFGLKKGRNLIKNHGKYFFLNEDHLELAEKWFHKYGDKAIFFTRLMPIVRTFISLPAGIGKMNFKKFVIYTILGSFPWCFALVYAGFLLGPYWMNIINLFHKFDIFIIMGLIGMIIFYFWKRKK